VNASGRQQDLRIALIGLPGSGKTTVGRQLAHRMSLQMRDADQLAEEQIGCSIREFFESQGEERFRDVEERVIAELVTRPRIVISTGGGVVLRSANRQHLHESTHVIYLRSLPEDVFRRLRHDRNRPLLQVRDPLGRLRELFEIRDPLYRETAHFVIETGRPSVATLVNMIVMQLELAGITP
jgi:shikimate kinase